MRLLIYWAHWYPILGPCLYSTPTETLTSLSVATGGTRSRWKESCGQVPFDILSQEWRHFFLMCPIFENGI